MKALKALLNNKKENLPKWVMGRIPHHYKRITCSPEEAIRLATIGQAKISAYFGDKLFFTQAVIAGACLSGDYDTVIVVTPSQYGKALDDDTPVLTRNGWKRHGDLKVGDEVVGIDGEFKKVLYVHPKCEMDRIVVLENGDEFICHHNHEWIYKGTKGRKREKCIRTLSVSEMEKRGVTEKGGKRKFVIPKHEPLKGEEKELSVPPYVMGAWLGDGSTTKGQICGCKDDIAVLDKCREYYPEGAEWTHKDTGVITRSFIGLASDLTAYNMCFQRKDTPEKHIPEEYMTASMEQRLELLAGLIDTDGYTHFDKRYGKTRTYFVTAGEQLKESFEKLIATFGWRTSSVRIEPRESTSGIKGKHPYWMIGFNPTLEIPCVLKRKRPIANSKQRGIGISEIKHTSGVQGNCITVEGGIYCVGKHMIPTHNSWLFGRIVPINAFEKKTETFVAGGDSDKTAIITNYMFRALQQSAPEMRNALNSESKDKLDKLATSVSKTKVSYKDGGSIEPLSLGEHYNGELSRNKSVGRGGDYFADEAALLSEETFAELGRRDFKSIDGSKGLMALISNPHKPGVFYDKLTEEDLDARTLVIWMDILTAVEEERTTEYNVLHSDFAKNKSTRKRYLMCELDTNDDSMFGEPKVYTEEDEGEYKQYFIGVDPAYKGKDTIEMAVVSLDETGFVRVEEIEKLHKSNWRDGGTSEEIIRTVVRKAKMLDAALMCIDVGWGVWLVEGVVRRNVACRGINFGSAPTRARVRNNEYAATNAARMRDEMHIDLQTLIDDEMIAFHKDAWDKVKEVFPFVTCSRNQSGNIQVRKKSEIKKSIGHSPDELDAVLLAIHAMMIAITGTPHFITGHE